jgi:hypothetical protein
MRKLIITLLVIVSTVTISAQNMFKPVPDDLFSKEPTADMKLKGNSIWLPRPAVTLTAIQWNWDSGTFHATAFQSVGLGIGWQHFIPTSDADLTPFNNFGFNALMLLGENILGALTFSGLGILNLGVTYNLTIKQFGLLTGVSLKF